MSILKRVFKFYYEGFKNMTLGKTLWIHIIIKLFIFFFIMKIFFFPDVLKKEYSTDEEISQHVLENLTNTK